MRFKMEGEDIKQLNTLQALIIKLNYELMLACLVYVIYLYTINL